MKPCSFTIPPENILRNNVFHVPMEYGEGGFYNIFFLRQLLHKISGADFLWKDNFHTWKLGEISLF